MLFFSSKNKLEEITRHLKYIENDNSKISKITISSGWYIVEANGDFKLSKIELMHLFEVYEERVRIELQKAEKEFASL